MKNLMLSLDDKFHEAIKTASLMDGHNGTKKAWCEKILKEELVKRKLVKKIY